MIPNGWGAAVGTPASPVGRMIRLPIAGDILNIKDVTGKTLASASAGFCTVAADFIG